MHGIWGVIQLIVLKGSSMRRSKFTTSQDMDGDDVIIIFIAP